MTEGVEHPKRFTITVTRVCSEEELEEVRKYKEGVLQYRNQQPKDQELHISLEKLRIYSENDEVKPLEFPPSLTAAERKEIHSTCELLGLDHQSTGFGSARHIVVKKKQKQPSNNNNNNNQKQSQSMQVSNDRVITETIYIRDYVGLEGPFVDTIACRDLKPLLNPSPTETNSTSSASPIEEELKKDKVAEIIVPDSYRWNRIKRDQSPNHHITLLTKDEVAFLLQNNNSDNNREERPKIRSTKDLFAAITERVVDDWEDLGLGRILQDNNTENNSNALTHNNQNVRDSTNCVFFRVVRWMSASLFREWLGLKPKDFHITVGFKVSDIHNFPKNESKLSSVQMKNVCHNIPRIPLRDHLV